MDKIVDRLFKYIRRDGRNADGKFTDTYLLQDKSPITMRFWYVSVSDDDGYDYFLQVGPARLRISRAANSDSEEYFQRHDEEIIL
jgi:hypothetical protein